MQTTIFDSAIINENIPINREVINKELDNKNCVPLIDAVYIPTLGKRPHLLKTIESLQDHSEAIYLLLSHNTPDWLKEIERNNVIIIENINNYDETIFSINSSYNPSVIFNKQYDIPIKRNYALKHSLENNYKIIGLVDDDIFISKENLIKCKKILTGHADLVGFYALDFPDVSTIDHIERYLIMAPSPVSIGGNCLFLKPKNTVGFFPYIYNEDWIFIFTNLINNKNVVGAGFVNHLRHEPWGSADRIKFEQFGEVIITGLKSRIIESNDIFTSDDTYWTDIYNNYHARIEKLFKYNIKNGAEWKKPLSYALESIADFTAEDLVNFINNYNTDYKTKIGGIFNV